MFDLVSFVTAAGYLGIAAIVFAETGLFVGFFLPGDSLLFTAGFLASQGFLNIYILLTISFLAAVAGDSFGYAFGKKVGPRLFTREDSVFFHKDHIERTRVYYEKYGGKTLILARFLPIVRTFAPILAGVGQMRYKTFLSYNVVGAAIWALGISLLGYFLGALVPDIDRYLLPIIILIVVLSLLPSLLHLIKDTSTRRRLITSLKKSYYKFFGGSK